MSTLRLFKKTVLFFTLSSATLISIHRAQANESISLNQVLGQVDDSPRIQRSDSMSSEASWKSKEAFSGLLPTFTAGATRLLDKEYLLTDVTLPGSPRPITIPQIIPTTSYNLGMQWVIFDGFANIQKWQGAQALASASKKENAWAKFQTRREAVLLFYRALAAQTLKDVAQQSVKTLEEHLSDVELFKRSGISTKYDVLRVDVQTSEARSELLNADDSTAVAKLRLGELLGKNLSQDNISGELPVLDPKAITSVQQGQADLSKREDIAAIDDRVVAANKMESAVGKYWVPKVSVTGQYQHYNNRNDSWSDEGFRDAYTVGLQAAWTFDGVIGPYTRDRQATEQRFQAEKTLEITKLKAANDVEFWRRRYLYFCNVYQARLGDIGKATESVRLAKEGRKAGIRTNTDLLDAELELFRARAGRVNAQIGAIESLVSLELATGQELYKF